MENTNITVKDGKRVRYWVNSDGIQEITQDREMWVHSYEEPIFDKFEDAVMFSIQSLNACLKDLEKKVRG